MKKLSASLASLASLAVVAVSLSLSTSAYATEAPVVTEPVAVVTEAPATVSAPEAALSYDRVTVTTTEAPEPVVIAPVYVAPEPVAVVAVAPAYVAPVAVAPVAAVVAPEPVAVAPVVTEPVSAVVGAVTEPVAVCHEDMECWDWKTMGNGMAGNMTVDTCPANFLLFADGICANPAMFVP